MSGVKLEGNALGTGVFTIKSPNSNTDRTFDLPDKAGTVALTSDLPYALTSGTAVSASGTSIDFTSIPSWVKRITVMLSGVSTSGTSYIQVRVGDSGGVVSSGYVGYYAYVTNAGATSAASVTNGFQLQSANASNNISGILQLHNISGNTWVANISSGSSVATVVLSGGGNITLTNTLDRIRITTVNGTDTFDAGSINILYE